jgi:ferredoxin-NADP reductase
MTSTVQLLLKAMELEAPGVLSLTLVHPEGDRLPEWTPGAHLDLQLGGLRRQYSLCGDPTQADHYRVAVLHEPSGRGGSRYVHEELRVGQIVELLGVRNNFALEKATHYTFVAGGIGITPLLTMIEHAALAGVPWNLVYGGRTRKTMAFLGRLADHGDRVAVLPQDEHGLLDLEPVMAGLPQGGLVYVCGPAPLIGAVRDLAETRHPELDPVRFELFAAPEKPTLPGTLAGKQSSRTASASVVLKRSGVTLDVNPDESILTLALAAGIDVDRDCEEGICGSCTTRIIDGQAEHRDLVLTRREQERQDCMMICVSRAASPVLTLDL